MKHSMTCILLSVTTALLWKLPVSAQRVEGQHPPPHRGKMMHPQKNPERGHPLVGRYLDQLKTHNPEEYERLKALRASDPEAFRQAMGKKVMKHRRAELRRQHPELDEILSELSPERREQLKAILFKSPVAQQHSSREAGTFRNERQEIKNLQQAIQKAGTTEDRALAVEELRDYLRGVHQQQLKERSLRIEKAAKGLEHLRACLEEESRNSDAWVEQQVQLLQQKPSRVRAEKD